MCEMKIKLLQKRIDEVVKYLKPFLPLANCHMVEFITQNHWNNLIPESLSTEIGLYGMQDAVQAFWCTRHNICKKSNIHYSFKRNPDTDKLLDKFTNLRRFVEEADNHCLTADNQLCLTMDQLKDKLNFLGAPSLDSLKLKEFMSDKKSHEVESLSCVVASLVSWSKVDYTVELGGGRGFLANMLMMFYGLPVLNIDCQEVNAKGAQERNRKLQKLWPGLVKKAEESPTGTEKEKISQKTHRRKNTIHNTQIDSQISGNTHSGSKDENVTNKLNDGIAELCIDDNASTLNEIKINNLYKHVTLYVTEDTDISKYINESFGKNSKDVNVCLTGLHTCGDLGSTSLKLYRKNCSASLLCVVPCCYHLLTEELVENYFTGADETLTGGKAGFPMSYYLRDFTIGRNARMLASQSIERVTAQEETPPESLFFRALLQVLLLKYNDKNPTIEGKLKNVAKKCSNFHEYVRASLKTLKLDENTISLSDVELDEFAVHHENFKSHMTMFYLLRMCLAQVVESLILLDRLMFLAENGFMGDLGDSVLVKMFDPVLSPRCHALISYRIKHIDK